MRSQLRGWTILALFFCSGATALVYEVVWSKFLAQMFGSTIYAQTVVLAVFMGGLALGNRIFGKWADRLRQPVRAYGLLEFAIGLYALLFQAVNWAADKIFVAAGSHIVEQPLPLLLLKGILAAGLLLGPTILMGGTLPLLAAWLQKSEAEAGRQSARFYSVNSLGAVAGAACAGFWLVQTLGMIGTLRATASVNILIGIVAIFVSRDETSKSPKSQESVATPASPELKNFRFGCLVVALTGGVSMGFEVLCSRSMALIFGSSLQSFAVVLTAFILGIGTGSAWIASPRRKGQETLIVILLCAAAASVALLVFNIERWVDFYRIARTGLARTPTGYVYHELLTVGISLVILGLPAALVGAVLPLMIRRVSGEGALLGENVGRLLTWNTLGAVGGTLLTGFILMPMVGLRNAFGVLALMLAVAALIVAGRNRWLTGIAASLCVCALTASLFIFGGESWKYVMSSGIFRIWETNFEPNLMNFRKQHMTITFYEDGPDATVSVEKVDNVLGKPMLGLRTNGKPEAGTELDLSTQLLVSHLPMLAKPGAKDVFVLGLASGMTAGAILGYPIDHMDVAENCEPVIRASHLFDEWNRHVLADPRTRLWREDARTVLKLRPQLYDVIITEPSNPWFVGTGSVFSREYYELAARRLKPGGIMAQWFQIYETKDDIVELVLRTFHSVFPNVEIWDAGAGDIVLLGSMQPWESNPDIFRKGFVFPRVKTDMWMIDIQSPEALWARQLASQRTAFAITGKGVIQSDRHPVLEYAAPRAFYLSAGSRMLESYDERTRQQLLAPPAKEKVLREISPPEAQLIFNDFMSVNGELYASIFGAPAGVGVPCVFPAAQAAPPPASSGSLVDQATMAFAAGNLLLARQIVDAILHQNPADPQAGYLSRIIERQLATPSTAATSANSRFSTASH